MVKTIEKADVVIVPVQIAYFFENGKQKWLYNFIDGANRANKIVWVYTAGDFGITLNADVYTFRLGGFDSKLGKKTFIVPSLIIDPYQTLNLKFLPIAKSSLPSIGFVGHANGSITKWAKEFSIFLYHNLTRMTKHVFEDYQPFYPSSIKRYRFLTALQKNNKIETNFIFRKKYRAGVITEVEKVKSTFEFFENIYDNPYVFCLRGAGNFSVRLYETLAMGRIPVVIDTDIRLPLDDIIDWKNHCIIAKENDFEDQLIDFHSTINEKDFEKMQVNNRNLWLASLNREGYFSSIHTLFKEIIK
ncbi:exostosin family protein [Flavobacterium sp. WC2430]|uniref:exostosin domain-containing protein n=1 Tax=Flavobacterium sp. WC2430 TaxID=3234137 RepID=UPI003466674A